MKEFRLYFNDKRLKQYRIFLFVWLSLGIASIAANPDKVFAYGYLVISLMYGALLYLEKNQPYLIIKDNRIIRNYVTRKSISIESITEVKHFAGEVIFRKDLDNEVRFDLNVLENEGLDKLNEVLPSYGLPSISEGKKVIS